MLNNDSVTLEYKMTPGEVLKYKSEVASKQIVEEEGQMPDEMESALEIIMTQAVQSVLNGKATIDVTIDSGTVKRDQEVLPLDDVGQKITMQMERNGNVLSTSVDFPFSQPAFPTRPLKPGDTWESINKMTVPIGDDDKTTELNLIYKYTLTKFDRLHGYDIAVIDIKCPPVTYNVDPYIKHVISADGSTKFAHTKGRLIASNVHTHTQVFTPEATITTDLNVSVDLMEAKNAEGTPPFASTDELFIIGK